MHLQTRGAEQVHRGSGRPGDQGPRRQGRDGHLRSTSERNQSCRSYHEAEDPAWHGRYGQGWGESRSKAIIETALSPNLKKWATGRNGLGGDLMETTTRWYHYIAWFFGGAFLANTIPHLVNGISGSPFQSPFAWPPGEGLSSAMVNVLWGMFTLVVGYVLVVRVGRFDLRQDEACGRLGPRHFGHSTSTCTSLWQVSWWQPLMMVRERQRSS